MTENTGRGVVTLADENYFPGLELLAQSVQADYPVPIVCFDIGLSREQKIRLANRYPAIPIH